VKPSRPDRPGQLGQMHSHHMSNSANPAADLEHLRFVVLAVIHTATNTVVDTITTGFDPWQIVTTPT
jgi:hypothetical protein